MKLGCSGVPPSIAKVAQASNGHNATHHAEQVVAQTREALQCVCVCVCPLQPIKCKAWLSEQAQSVITYRRDLARRRRARLRRMSEVIQATVLFAWHLVVEAKDTACELLPAC